MTDLDDLEKKARGATPGPWMRLFGERTVYDRMEDGCRGNAIVRADLGHSQQDGRNLDFIAAANPSAILDLIARCRKAEEAAEFNFEQYQDASRLLNEECEKTERLQARVAELEAQSGEVVYWESRFLDCSNNPDGVWTTWERVVPRNQYTDTVEDRVAEFRHYIAHGYKYELRPLYLRAPQAVQPSWESIYFETVEASLAEACFVKGNLAATLINLVRQK